MTRKNPSYSKICKIILKILEKPLPPYISLLSMGRCGRLSLGGGDLVLRHSRPRTVGMRGPATAPNLHSGFATVLLLLLLLLTSEVAARREGRILSNPFGLLGHTACSSDESGDGQAVGMMMQDAMGIVG